MHHFEKLEVWRRSCRLVEEVYRTLRDTRDYAFRDQMIRSALSIPSNIAEGSERGSEPDFAKFLRYSKGSAAELRTQLAIAANLSIIEANQARELVAECKELSAMLEGLIRSLRH